MSNFGSADRFGDDDRSMTRMAASGKITSGTTVSRFCAAGENVLRIAVRAIQPGEVEVTIDSKESMMRAHFVIAKPGLPLPRKRRSRRRHWLAHWTSCFSMNWVWTQCQRRRERLPATPRSPAPTRTVPPPRTSVVPSPKPLASSTRSSSLCICLRRRATI